MNTQPQHPIATMWESIFHPTRGIASHDMKRAEQRLVSYLFDGEQVTGIMVHTVNPHTQSFILTFGSERVVCTSANPDKPLMEYMRSLVRCEPAILHAIRETGQAVRKAG